MAELVDWLHHESITRAATNSGSSYMPTADVVERKHGEWNYIQAGMSVCPYCGASPHDYFKNYCPNCGADMRE